MEYFPVMRKLLRPCLSLTSTVQLGRGIYRENIHTHHINDNNSNSYDSKNDENLDDYIREFINNNNDKTIIDGINDMYNEDDINNNDGDLHHAVSGYINGGTSSDEASTGDPMDNTIRIDVDSCTFDKVLLYLEHEVGAFICSWLLIYICIFMCL
jgi:hypothetical protein